MTTRYQTIIADPPWQEKMVGAFKGRHARRTNLPYATMTIQEICALPISTLAAPSCHLWLWTTNSHLEASFTVMRAWGFTYLTTITWVKPSGFGAYFASTTQHCLFGYYHHCNFPLARWRPTNFAASVPRHSQKPERFFDLVESISPAPRLELFARQKRFGWDAWGNEVASDLTIPLEATP